MGPKELLVVDDEWDCIAILSYLLEAEGHHVSPAHNGVAALEVLATTAVDLVLTDFMMPDMDGCVLLRSMRANSETCTTPVLMLSELSEGVVREKCELVSAFLHKPFSPQQLLSQVHALLCPVA